MAVLKPGVFATSLNGSSANAVFVRTRNGIVVRDRIVPHDPRTPAQIATRQRLQRVGQAWLGLSLAQAQAWRDYAASLQRVDLDTGALIGPRAQTLFSKLSLKFLQANPTGEIPLTPPDSAFAGDGIGVSSSPSDDGIRFTSTGPNGAGVVTELLVQPLASIHRRAYRDKYRPVAFYAFDGESYEAPLPPGAYATAYRFVCAATGQESALFESGLVVVGG